MKRLGTLLLGISLAVLQTGCCGWPMYGYPGYGYGGGCQNGACGTSPMGVYPPQTGYLSTNTVQAGVPTGPVVASPVATQTMYPMTAVAPLESLPTYR